MCAAETIMHRIPCTPGLKLTCRRLRAPHVGGIPPHAFGAEHGTP